MNKITGWSKYHGTLVNSEGTSYDGLTDATTAGLSPLVATDLAISSTGDLSASNEDLALNILPLVAVDSPANNLVGDEFDATMSFTTAAEGLDLDTPLSLT